MCSRYSLYNPRVPCTFIFFFCYTREIWYTEWSFGPLSEMHLLAALHPQSHTYGGLCNHQPSTHVVFITIRILGTFIALCITASLGTLAVKFNEMFIWRKINVPDSCGNRLYDVKCFVWIMTDLHYVSLTYCVRSKINPNTCHRAALWFQGAGEHLEVMVPPLFHGINFLHRFLIFQVISWKKVVYF